MDPFASIADQEAEVIQRGQRKIDLLERQIRLCHAIRSVRQAAGWKEYHDAVIAIADYSNSRLLDEAEQKREYLAGFCSGLAAVLAVADKADEQLLRSERQLAELKEKSKGWTPEGRIINRSPI